MNFDVNMLFFTVSFAGLLGPKFTVFNESLFFTYPSGGFSLDPANILRTEAPFTEVEASALASEGDASSFDAIKLLVASGLAASNGAAKRLLEQGGVSVNKRKISAAERHVPTNDALLRGGHVVIGKGKRDFALLRVRE